MHFASALALAAALLPLAAHADTIGALPVGPITIAPGADTIALSLTPVVEVPPGVVPFQNAIIHSFYSPIPDQTILFSFVDIITIDGVTLPYTISGQDIVTTTTDTISTFAGPAVTFGPAVFTLQAQTFPPLYTLGDIEYLTLNATLLPATAPTVPEPSSLVLIGTGLAFVASRSRSRR